MPYQNPELERKVLELTKQGFIDAEIGEMTGYSPSNVWKIRKKYGIPANKRRKVIIKKKTIYSEDLFLAERKFSIKYRSKNLVHRPLAIINGVDSIFPSFYDPTTCAFVFLLSRQRWSQLREVILDSVGKFAFMKNAVLINSETLDEFRPALLEEELKERFHKNFENFILHQR